MGSVEALAIGVLFDVLIGEPPSSVHPVVWMGRLASWLARPSYGWGRVAQLVAGGAICLVVVAGSAGAAWVLRWLAIQLLGGGAVVVEGLVLGALFAMRGLLRAGASVRESLLANDLSASRTRLRALCSRDASQLTPSEIASASISSLAENTCDSVVAPLFYYALLGLPGAAMYRAANTLDAVLGYRDHREYVGKVSARLDDVLNWLPARLTALAFALAGMLSRGLQGRISVPALIRDAGSTESPNAGWPMATVAQLLGVKLEKSGHYCLGGDGSNASPHSLVVAQRLCVVTFALSVLVLLLGLSLVG